MPLIPPHLRGQGEPRISESALEQKEVTKEFEDGLDAWQSLQKAVPCQLEVEWFVFFLREIRAGKSVQEACFAAQCEWDL